MAVDAGIKAIPVRVIGPGSQPESLDGQTLSYIEMPGEIERYHDPAIPDPDAFVELEGAREAMAWLQKALATCAGAGHAELANLAALDPESRDLVNQILGEGEVAVQYDGTFRAKSQETVLAGVWRTLFMDSDDKVICDLLEVSDVPHTVRMSDDAFRPVDISRTGLSDDLGNAVAVLIELRARSDQYLESRVPHAINLTLLPLTQDELEFLDARLGRGPVDTLSRAYGKCQVFRTLTPNIWWVRYYNSMGTLILNTLEVADIPAAIRAAPEDIAESAKRLDCILAPYWSDGP
tara:strand:- start:780 stop:1658 length:879 start_codon:yes stop_codon:yes gene_type:complete